MNQERARRILQGRAFVLEDLQRQPMQESFLLSMRPFKGLKCEECAN